MKKIILLFASLLMVLMLVGCEGASTSGYRIGIVQLANHPALNAATEGFEDALKEKLGDEVAFDYQNASGESANCATIVNGFISDGVSLIFANATSPLQAAAAATDSIPIVGTSITHYGTALGIDNWTGSTGRNITGSSDLAPLDQQAAIIKELFPDAKKVGLLYCTSEANSIYQNQVIEPCLKELGFEVQWFGFSDSNDITSVTENACAWADVMYIPTDNVAADNTEAILNVLVRSNVPAVTGEEGICAGCGVATLSINYYDLGKLAGEMAYDILVNGADPSTMEIKLLDNLSKKYSKENCDKFNITVPEGYEVIE